VCVVCMHMSVCVCECVVCVRMCVCVCMCVTELHVFVLTQKQFTIHTFSDKNLSKLEAFCKDA